MKRQKKLQSKGSALVQVIGVTGLLIFVSYASMQIQENISKTTKKSSFNNLSRQFENQLNITS